MGPRALAVVALAAAVLASPAGPAAAHEGVHAPVTLGQALARPFEEPFASGSPATTPNVDVLAHSDPGSGPGTTADVYALGDHAYLASWWAGGGCPAAGVRVYDIRNPRRPRLVSTFADRLSEPDVAGSWTEKVIVKHVASPAFTGDLAAVSFQSCPGHEPGGPHGWGLYDVTDAAAPRRLAFVRSAANGSHELYLAAAGGRAYVYTAVINQEFTGGVDADGAQVPGTPDFQIFDVSEPTAPRAVGGWGAWRELGISTAGLGTFLSGQFVHSVMVNPEATRAYLSYWDLGTVILDIGDSAHPRYLGRTTFGPSEEGDAHSAAIAGGGRLLIESTETFWGGHLRLFDVANPAAPVYVSSFSMPDLGTSSAHVPQVVGDRAYVSWYQRGVVVTDLSTPWDMQRVAQFVPAPAPGQFCATPCAAVWGVFPHRGYVLASDMNSGLWIFRVRG